MNIDDLPPEEKSHLQEQVLYQISSMDEANARIISRSRESLAYYIAELSSAFAAAAGFIIALPWVWAIRLADSIGGWMSGFRPRNMDL